MGRIAVLLAMSHTEVMDHGTAQEHLRDMMSAVSKPSRPKRIVIGTKHSNPFGVIIAQGRIVFEYAKMMMGDEAMSQMLKSEKKLRLPRGFGPHVVVIACIVHAQTLCENSLRNHWPITFSLCGRVLPQYKECSATKMPHRSDRRRVLQTALNVPSSGTSSTTGSLTAFRYTMPDFTSRYFLSEHGI